MSLQFAQLMPLTFDDFTIFCKTKDSFQTWILIEFSFQFFGLSQLAKDLLHPLPAEEKRKHKLKRLVQHPNSYFMDVKCPGCYKITTVFSHAQGVVVCAGCSTILCQPTGGRAKLTEGNINISIVCKTMTNVFDGSIFLIHFVHFILILCTGCSFRRKPH